jgi:TM2 domain-containing membrane protein YozV
MTNFILTDTNGTKHSVNEQLLRELAAQGKITPTTSLETDDGHTGLAGQVPGLKFSTAAPTPFAQSTQTAPQSPPPPVNVFCTNCGNPVTAQAVACMSCGAKPIGHKKFCRQCGVALNPEQVVCIKCGAGIKTGGGGTSAGTLPSWEKKKLVAGLLGIFLGGIGAHKYYMGSWGWGIVFTAACILTMGFLGIVTSIIGLIEGIMFLVSTEEAFAEKYPPETENPFRW